MIKISTTHFLEGWESQTPTTGNVDKDVNEAITLEMQTDTATF